MSEEVKTLKKQVASLQNQLQVEISRANELYEALEMIIGVFNMDLYATNTGGGKCYVAAQHAMRPR
jgi:hypothetical protein